jgi:hypothetical protein
MADLDRGAEVLIVDRRDPHGEAWRAKVLFKQPRACQCGGAVYHCEVSTGEHANYCASMLQRAN